MDSISCIELIDFKKRVSESLLLAKSIETTKSRIKLLIRAQIFPFKASYIVDKSTCCLLNRINDDETLLWFKNVLEFYQYILIRLRSFSIFKKKIDNLLLTIENNTESIDFYLENKECLEDAIESIEQGKSIKSELSI
ncbi:MAG: hypothetical protein A2Y62_18040 [Candidatus Fischerbacteria bacterium RBG_13_37_8]|uniref:Uncharacterized protein n=1 Tax=Candidatus Fischerbacteria bacterium RBG_13_37_8 TaxID=1817863 RepID=A0A1F5VWZ5_9BACT|nr:MAG: hypothetical protein A2Y62_18040 [Candidatus Fischerbacteria bacterium RBG_13_37_8]